MHMTTALRIAVAGALVLTIAASPVEA